ADPVVAVVKEVRRFVPPQPVHLGTAVSGDGRRLAGIGNRVLYFWDVGSGKLVGQLDGLVGQARSLQLSHDGKRAVLLAGGTLQVWDTDGRRLVASRQVTNCVRPTFVPNKPQVLFGSQSDLLVWDWQKNQIVRTLTGHKNSVTSIAVTADGSKALT